MDTSSKKEWYIKINDNCLGPYSFEDLEQNLMLTPDTLAWKEGLKTWTPLRHIPQLKKLFEDKKRRKKSQKKDGDSDSEEKPFKKVTYDQPEIALNLRYDPPQLFLWLALLLVIIYVLFKFTWLE